MSRGMATLPMTLTVAEAVTCTSDRLAAAGVPSPGLDARLLVASALGVRPVDLLSDPRMPVPEAAASRLSPMVARRIGREPVARILGQREFWSLPFKVTPATLDPRPDSETLVDAVLRDTDDRNAPLRLLDIGAGSGCLLLALLHELPRVSGVGVDVEPHAVATARDNAADLGLSGRVRFAVADWRDAGFAAELGTDFDRIVANPPYIPDDEIAGLDPEVSRHDPWMALAGGADGLDAYRQLGPHMAGLTAPGGRVYMEIGAGQRRRVAAILGKHGVRVEAAARDLSGYERCLVCAVAAKAAKSRRAAATISQKKVPITGSVAPRYLL